MIEHKMPAERERAWRNTYYRHVHLPRTGDGCSFTGKGSERSSLLLPTLEYSGVEKCRSSQRTFDKVPYW